MKKRVRFTCLLFFVLVLAFSLPCSAKSHSRAALFPVFRYEGIITRDTCGLVAGERVRMVESESDKSHLVERKNGRRVRVDWDAVSPVIKERPALPSVTEEDVVAFVYEMGYGSKTDFMLFTDLSRFCTYVLEYGDEGWHLLRTLPCSVGDALHPTPSGRFEVAYKCACIGKTDQYLCRHAMCFYGGYMYHSVLLDWKGETVLDGRLSSAISHGCIRHSPEDSATLYALIPTGSAVYIR
ncbi:MAG: L,D-transpeptidase [Clostridia bacterium]|nr:L,D-transpeptidase [Clostridia bacterium]